MYGKIIINLLLAFLVVLLQLGFISGLPLYFASLNLILISLVFILEISDLKTALLWVLAAGFLIDIYYFKSPGTYFLSLLAAIFLMDFLLEHFFTNRSLYSFLALIFFGHLIFKFSWYIYKFLLSFVFKDSFDYILNFMFLKNEIIELFINMMAVAIGFYIINFVGSNFKPVFLIKKRK